MKILYIHQYFKTPNEPGGTRSFWIAQKMIEKGHEVIMLTTSTEIDTRKKIEVINGIKVIYLKVPYDNNMGFVERLMAFFKFMIRATWTAIGQKEIDLVFATSTPLTIGFPALILNKLKRTPFIFEVRDLWPEVPIQMGALNNKMLVKASKSFEKKIYKKALHIITLSPGMYNGVLDCGISKENVSMVPNMAKIDKFFERPKNQSILEKFKLKENTFKLIYFGALGKANAIEYILEAAKKLKKRTDIEFIFIGKGAMLSTLENTIKNERLQNVKHLGAFDMATTSELVNICDASLVTFNNLPILATNSPNKLFDSLSAGKPIIVNSSGWTKKLVEEYKCGVYVDPNEVDDFISKINYLKDNPQELKTMGKNSRLLAENVYDKNILCENVMEIVTSAEHKIMRN